MVTLLLWTQSVVYLERKYNGLYNVPVVLNVEDNQQMQLHCVLFMLLMLFNV